jgi:hypothetical protein
LYISLNEQEDAERYKDEYDLGKDAYNKLVVIAKDCFTNLGYGEKRTHDALCEYISRRGKSPLLNYWSDMIDAAVKRAKKQKLIVIDSIPISKSELDRIDKLDGVMMRKLAFTLLCLSKYRDLIVDDNNHWICFEDKDIMSMANVKVSLIRQAELYRRLKDLGYLQFPKKQDSISMRVLFGDEEQHDPVINITNFKNLGYQYLKYKGEPYFECECCGTTVKRSHPEAKRPQKYCDKCAALMQAKQKTDYVMRLKGIPINQPAV